MSIMRPPKLGPIVGHTTDRSCRALEPRELPW